MVEVVLVAVVVVVLVVATLNGTSWVVNND